MNGLKAYKMKKGLKIILGIVVALSLVSLGYLETGHYNANDIANNYPSSSENDNYLSYDNNSDIGFIFYPGAKVESGAYSYLSEVNANVYIAKFPFELAMFDYRIADQIMADNPQINTWYIGGHSLGGVFANRYAVSSTKPIAGIVFLGSYPADGDQSDIPGIALFGDRDLIVGDYKQKTSLFMNNQQVIVLLDANHSGFGNYGQQKGDSELTADQIKAEQRAIIDNINQFIDENS